MTSVQLGCSSRYSAVKAASQKATIFEGPGTSAFDRFLDAYKRIAHPSYPEGDEPPRKRQRLEKTSREDIKHPLEPRIPIARITLNIASEGESRQTASIQVDDSQLIENVIDVRIIEAEQIDEREKKQARHQAPPYGSKLFVRRPLKLTLLAPQSLKNCPCLSFELVDELDQKSFDILSTIAYLERRIRTKERGVVHAQSRLVRSNGHASFDFTLECSIVWSDGASAFDPRRAVKNADWEILTRFFPEPGTQQESHINVGRKNPARWIWSPQDFYDNVYSPPTDLPLPEILAEKVLDTDLYPFQKRAVAWMLDREKPSEDKHHLSFDRTKDANGNECFVSHLQGVVRSTLNSELLWEPQGGILAEEMGLGKTCELIALICLNTRPSVSDADLEQALSRQDLISSRATLIVTPPTILQQWIDELNKHAPHLSVVHYNGMSDVKKSKKDEQQLLRNFATKDVILTTYNVLAKEVHYAVNPPDRSLRHREKRERPRSPLVRLHWWRICLDEGQMVESGVSAAARVASLLSRENAWAVSGTPLRKNVEDLFGLLIFLRYQPFCDSSIIWDRMLTQYESIFEELFGRITLRHTKDKIRNELRLPPQRRVVLTMPFTTVEDQNYKGLFEEMCEDIGCATDGSPLHDEWNSQSSRVVEHMRSWLVRLRQTCLHPQVGGRNRRALGRGTAPLRTVAEVLEVMIDQNETAIRTEARLTISGLLQRAHIIANARDDDTRSIKALAVYKTALQQAGEIVSECRAELGKLGGDDDDAGSVLEDSDVEQEKTPEHAARMRSRAALHSALQMQHACAFFVGTAYFQIKSNQAITKPDSHDFKELEDQETSYYDVAKAIRKELLLETASKAERFMEKVAIRKNSTLKESSLSSLDSPGGIENVRLISKAEDLAEILDSQAGLINKWRSKVVELLLKPLVDEDEGKETTGDEYEDSTKQQDTLYAYNDALRAVVADRGTCLTGQSAPLVDHEMNVLLRDAKEEKGHAPDLMLKLLAQRNILKQKNDSLISLRGLTHEARGLETSLQWQEGNGMRAGAELSIVKQQMKVLAGISTEETKAMAELERGLDLFRSTMNQRLEYYRQLQHISDMVAPYKEELDETLDTNALDDATKSQETRAKVLAQLKTKHRFLVHLREESTRSSEAERICVICQCPFEQGVLTICGHQFCKECIQHWWKEHRTCPVCKRRLTATDFHDVTYKPQELRAEEETHSNSESSSPSRSTTIGTRSSSIYSDIGSGTLAQIKSIDLNGSYGTKIDTLARHILWLRQYDAGAKSIVFSQYREFLDVLSTAFKQFGIGFSRISERGSIDRFRQDPSVEVFLLDAKTDSSGLNLVNAQYVFLAEPLINTAIELQAIARVHRIGQQRPTTVYMYLIGDTVEEAIYDISVTRRLAHMQKTNGGSRPDQSRSETPMTGEAAIDSANSLELQQAPLSRLLVKGKGGGEVVPQDDLWGCLFGKTSGRKTNVSDELQEELGRHLRAEAAEERSMRS
ncbi:SNF2 family N-terminal domain-containing protein [Delphinella strobiligena]|nr:SNF2 family N-terminal domain-containing protein [Delphinella strobiligena]